MARPNVEDRPSTVNRSDRPKRVPINGHRDILSVHGKEPGYHYCWVPEHLTSRYEGAGYDYVTHEVIVGDRRINAGSQVGAKVSLPVGNGQTGFLMRCEDSVFLEERRLSQSEADRQENAMRSAGNEAGRYGEVEIGRGQDAPFN